MADSSAPDPSTPDVPDASDASTRPPLRASVLRQLLAAPAGPLARVEVVERTGSTNDDLVAALRERPQDWPDVGLLVADHQAGGRGRAGHGWETPPRAALTLSLVLRPGGPPESLSWLPLLAGLGAVRALNATAGVAASLKWPNDVLVPAPDGTVVEGWGATRKVGGILTELVGTADGPADGAGPAVVVGIGLNVSQAAAELPVPHATSLALAGAATVDREVLLVALVSALAEIQQRWREHQGDVHAAGLADEVAAECSTLGGPVLVELPGGGEVAGLAVRLDPQGALVVEVDGHEQVVLAGDVRHVRRGR
ncbi:biotin--[acetyl-CoA-carboxylase] ligase [Cellulomonas hominis]